LKEKLDLQKGGTDHSKIVWYREQVIEKELFEATTEATSALQTVMAGAT